MPCSRFKFVMGLKIDIFYCKWGARERGGERGLYIYLCERIILVTLIAAAGRCYIAGKVWHNVKLRCKKRSCCDFSCPEKDEIVVDSSSGRLQPSGFNLHPPSQGGRTLWRTPAHHGHYNLHICWKGRAAFFAWRAHILSWPRIMCSQVHMLKFLEPSREMP